MLRAVRILTRVGEVVGVGGIFLTSLVAGVVAHLDAPVVRRATVWRLNGVLGTAVAGRIVIDRVGSMSATGVSGVDAHVVDPDGTTVLRVSSVAASLDSSALLQSLASSNDLQVDIGSVTIDRVDVSLDGDERGLRIARAFGPAHPETPSSRGGRGLRMNLPHAFVHQVKVHGRPPGAPPVDGEVDDADLGVAVAPEALSLDVRHARVVARDMPPPATTQGTLDAHVVLPTATGATPELHATWDGKAGAVPVTLAASIEDGRSAVVVDVPKTRPEDLRTLWPACPFAGDSAVHVKANGDLERLVVDVRASVGTGTVVVTGPVVLGDAIAASLHVDARAIDVHALAGSAPASDLSASADVDFTRTLTGAMGALVSLQTPGGTLAGARIPSAGVTGRMESDGHAPPALVADVVVHEPGAPARATVHLDPHGTSYRLTFDASADSPDLGAIHGIGGGIGGSVRATAHGTLDLETTHLDATADATIASVHAGAASLESARFVARAWGPVSAPSVDLDLRGQSLGAGPLRFDTVHAWLEGAPTHAPVHVSLHGHDADFVARGDLDLQRGVTLRNASVSMDRDGESARARAALVELEAGDVEIRDLDVDGLGSPLHATARVTAHAIGVHATSHGLDLARLGHLAGETSLAGRVSLDANVEVRRDSADGHVALDLTQGAFAGWKDAKAHADVTLAGRKASGTLDAALGDIGSFGLSTTSVEIGKGNALAGSTWRGAWGGVDVKGHVDLAKLAAHLPPGTLPSPTGTVDLAGHVERDDANDSTPDVDLTLKTAGLGVGLAGTRLDDLGVTTHVTVDGRTGHTAVAAELHDHVGPLVAIDASSDGVPYGPIFTSDAPLRDALLAMPLQATVILPTRGMSDFPELLGTRGMEGQLQARVDFKGSAEAPSVDLHATLGAGKPDPTFLALPVDVALVAHYDGARATTTITATHKDVPVLSTNATIDVRAHDLLAGTAPPWKASAQATLTNFPLQSLAALDNRQVRGKASGTLRLDGLHDDARASADLDLTEVQVGDVPSKDTTFRLSADGHAIDLSTRITEVDGYAEARAHLGAKWGSALAPSPDAATPAQVYFAAKNFRTAVLLPFVSGVFTELDGRLDAMASATIDPSTRSLKPQGKITLREGVFELSALGTELHDASATVTLTPDGVVKLDSLSARGLTGRIEAAASGRFQGFDFTGAHALIQVPKKEPLPLVADGAQVGLFDGRIDVDVQRTPSALGVDVSIPTMRLQLPLSAGHDVQTLGPMKDVQVGIEKNGEFTTVHLGGELDVPSGASGGTPMRIAVKLGKDVEVKRGADLDVRLEGGPVLDVGKRVTAKGQIRLTHGSLTVQGKTFNIDNGTVTFVDDPTNPQIVLTASFVAGDTTIFADFIGPLKTGKVTLRSEPMMGQDEILSTLLYGTPDQSGSAASGGAGAPQLGAASGAVGNQVTAGLNQSLSGVNQALDNLGLQGGISTKLDTSQVTPRPEVEVQIARDISLQIAWVLGVPPPGSNPDQHLFTLNWRFLRQWSVETTVGDAGTSILDLVWQHRY